MSLNRNEKAAVVTEVAAQAAAAQTLALAEYRGLTVAHMDALRKQAREQGVYLHVLKNTLARRAVAGTPFEVVSAADYPGLPEVIEDGTTILGNATRKALITAAYTGEIAVADDTSLQVRELVGWPDIFAARFSGPDATYESNARLVLELMRDVPAGYRQARFATACCWIDPRPELVAYDVRRPATRRWLRNPWLRAIELQDKADEWSYWNGFVDRAAAWRDFATAIQDHCEDAFELGHDGATGRSATGDCDPGRRHRPCAMVLSSSSVRPMPPSSR